MKNRHGFTIIEVSFFLAITGLLFLAVTIGVQSSIYRQRYNDSVQSFVEFLRGVYAETTNVQNNGTGRSDSAIYGKLVTFGESKNLLGEANTDKAMFVYDVVGDIEGMDSSGSSDIKTLLASKKVNVMVEKDTGEMELAGIVESYVPKWSAKIQNTAGGDFAGALLIIRHPRSGDVYTLFKDNGAIEVNENKSAIHDYTWFVNQLSGFKVDNVDFCITPDGFTGGEGRADVRVKKWASGSSGVEVINDSSDNNCN